MVLFSNTANNGAKLKFAIEGIKKSETEHIF